jgi:hypothetical protein
VIYEFALEPELVATWHDRRAAYPVLCQMDRGQKRVPCAFPSRDWRKLVMAAFSAATSGEDTAPVQEARKRLDVLLHHMNEVGTRREGKLEAGETWPDAAIREHAEFPFGGILVRSSESSHPHVVAFDRLGEDEFSAWSPPAPPVPRQSRELAAALEPLLRCAAELRFVDPYFDAGVPEFFEPMRAYLIAAQRRRNAARLQLQIHFAVRPDEVRTLTSALNRPMNETTVAERKLSQCEACFLPLLQPGVQLRIFARKAETGSVRLHNRYVLAEIGGIALQYGLDASKAGSRQTDDLTVLSRQQLAARWAEFSAITRVHHLIADRTLVGRPSSAE